MYLVKCILYAAGLNLTFAFDDLSFNAVTSQSKILLDPLNLYVASHAVDRNTATCMRTVAIGGTADVKSTWWKVDLGGTFNIYSINILFKNYDNFENRQRGRLAGFSLYVSNTGVIQGSTQCYKDGPQLPPLNFTTECIESGRYVIFYNERLAGVPYPSGYELTNMFTELCEVIVKGCKKLGVYGSKCDSPCPVKCKDNTCHIKSGACLDCEDGVYGGYCNLSCPANCRNNICHTRNGTCSECQHGLYGSYCNMPCPKNCKDNICNIQSGVCLECGHGVYGSYCNLSCPTNCKDNTCHIQNGACSSCKPGWTGLNCDKKCTDGLYGDSCGLQCSGHCRDGSICNHVTGQCDRGCATGWTGIICEKGCDDGTYGYDCNKNCSGHCRNDFPCNKLSGQCDGGCDPGYTNAYCSKKCKSNYFGLDCKERCSTHCKISENCNHVSGRCPDGCQDGYIDEYCNSSCKAGWYGKNCSDECSQSCNGTCDPTDGSCNNCEGSKSYCSKVPDGSSHNSPKALSVTVGGIVGAFMVLIVGVIFFFILRIKRKTTIMNKRESMKMEMKPHMAIKNPQTSDHKFLDDKANVEANCTYALPEKTKRGPPTNRNISVRNIMAQISNMSANENAGFKNEYHDIPRGELHPCTEAKKPENKAKNRYTTIYPYDHSRIILKPVASEGSGYINGNYIEDTRGRRLYIATQGPKPKTIADFWTMIWQEEVCNIVCLTNLTEGTKNKCAQYWPDINDKLQGGTLTVRHLEEKSYAEYIIRRFKMHNKTTRSDRQVTMFHYTTWSDHGVADPLSLVVFHRHVIRTTANSAGKYTVVHCSAGVGRTGTYIALDALYREGERTGKINVPMYVRTMRKDRMNMIQGDDQYKLLYLALKDAFHGQNKCVDTEKFLGEYQEQTCYTNCGDLSQKKSLSSDLEELLSLKKEYTQQDYISGRAQISANYTESVLPVEEFMCHLYYMKGYNTYYNAVLIQSYLEKDSLISAQYPLPDSTEDFLRLIKDFDARVVVFLCPLEDIESTSKWFPPENQHKFNGIFYVKNMSSTRSNNVKLTRLNIQPTGFNEMDITLLECPTWGERLKRGDKRVLLDVVKAVKTEKSDQKGRVLVMSRDGATRCGPFFVVYNVLEQISMDREVDIFTAVRQIQIRRPECVSTVDEYKLCHDAVAEYLLNDCVYGNC